MDLRLYAFIRESPGGLFIARVVGRPGIKAFGDSKDAALSEMRKLLENQAGWRESGYWERCLFEAEPELRSLAVEVPLERQGASLELPVTVSLLVAGRSSPAGDCFLITAPKVKGFQLVVRDPAEIEEQARAALVRVLRKRKPAEILEANVDGEEAIEQITVTLPEKASDEDGEGGEDEPGGDALSSLFGESVTTDVLKACGIRMTSAEIGSWLRPAVCRDALMERIIDGLASERLSSIMLVGRGGVGKTALVNELVRRLREGQVPDGLKGRELWCVRGSELIAGQKYTGEWQGQIQRLVRQVAGGRQILYMDDPSELVDAGRWSGGDNNMARFLRPYVENGRVNVICECTPETFAAETRREAGFMLAFRKIEVPETSDTETLEVVQAAARQLEAEHPVSIDAPGIATSLDLSRRFLPYHAFPGKAVRVLEEAVRDLVSRPGSDGGTLPVGREEVISGFTRSTGLPRFLLSDEVRMQVGDVRNFLEERLLGQPEAVGAVVDLVTVLKAGLNDPQKPLGSFFFVGPTGVGKTETAKVLAEFLFGSRDRLLRFDMGEFSSPDAVPRLIGSAWGAQREGELTRRVREQPFSVVLLDELEKAHPEVFDALLGVLGEGRLTDAGGRTTEFRNAIIIMTSNLGASRRETQPPGFSHPSDAEAGEANRLQSHFIRQAEAFFRPEFFNRIDRIVSFRPLSRDALRRITRRELGKLLMREGMARRNLLVEMDDTVIDHLMAVGFHPAYGARPLQRAIERSVIVPLAQLLVEQETDEQSLLRISARNGGIRLNLSRIEPSGELAAAARPAPAAAPDSGLAAVVRGIQQLRARLAHEEGSPFVGRLRQEVSTLLARTQQPAFWDEPEMARETMRRVYHLERLLKRLDSLEDRVAGLERAAERLRGQRQRSRAADLAQSLERVAADLSYLEVELAGAASGDDRSQALVRIHPVGEEAERWATRLLEMYAAWAERKGYEHTAAAPGDVPEAGRPVWALYVEGSNVFELLRSEAGLHRINEGSGEDRTRFFARVSVTPVPVHQAVRDRAALVQALPRLTAAAEADEESLVARVYSLGRHRGVKDPRTSVETHDVDAVLERGQLDPFMLAHLRRPTQATAAAPS